METQNGRNQHSFILITEQKITLVEQMSQTVASVYICPWSLRDPLCQSQSLSYLLGLTAYGYKFALITFENPKFALDREQTAKQRQELETKGIYWYPVAYHQGLSIKAKLIDNLNGIRAGLKAWRRHRPQVIHVRSSLPTATAVALTQICRTKLLYDADSMLSEEYVDIGHLTRQSAAYRVLAKSEELARRMATQIIVLTEHLRQDYLKEFKVAAPVTVIPCCVNIDKFSFNLEHRDKRRAELGLTSEKLFTYVGKLGSWYLIEETFDFFKVAQEEMPSAKLLIVTEDSPDVYQRIAREKEIRENSYFIKKATPAEVAEWLSASDAGLAFIKTVRSKRGSSPVKVPEYLAAGLPVIITDKIGDCSRLVRENKIGAVLEETKTANYLNAVKILALLWAKEPEQLAARCRRIAEENFSLEKIGVARYHQIYQELLQSSRRYKSPAKL